MCSYSRVTYASAASKFREQSPTKLLADMENVNSNWI